MKLVTRNEVLEESKAVLKIIAGNSLLGFAYAKWMKPNGIINGGVTSMAMILEKVTNVPIVYLTSGITTLLLVFCWLFLGKASFYNLFFALFYYMKIDFQVNLMLDFLFASLFIAVGYYCCITANASTVGMDVIAMAINKKRPDFSIARGIRYINFMVLILGFLTYGFKSVVIGLLFSFVNSYLLDFLLKRSSR